jgi:hypothetical protein
MNANLLVGVHLSGLLLLQLRLTLLFFFLLYFEFADNNKDVRRLSANSIVCYVINSYVLKYRK